MTLAVAALYGAVAALAAVVVVLRRRVRTLERLLAPLPPAGPYRSGATSWLERLRAPTPAQVERWTRGRDVPADPERGAAVRERTMLAAERMYGYPLPPTEPKDVPE